MTDEINTNGAVEEELSSQQIAKAEVKAMIDNELIDETIIKSISYVFTGHRMAKHVVLQDGRKMKF